MKRFVQYLLCIPLPQKKLSLATKMTCLFFNLYSQPCEYSVTFNVQLNMVEFGLFHNHE